jgi:hypothetical protein
MKTLLLAIAALICMTSFAGAQPACAPFPWCAHGNWLDKHCWCYRYRGPQWSHGDRWGDDGWGGEAAGGTTRTVMIAAAGTATTVLTTAAIGMTANTSAAKIAATEALDTAMS